MIRPTVCIGFLFVVTASIAWSFLLIPGLVPRSDVYPTGIPMVRQHSFVEISYEIISTVILSLLLIHVGQLLVTGERISAMYWFNSLSLILPRKSVVRLTDHLVMTIVVDCYDWDVKQHSNKTNKFLFIFCNALE